MVVAATARGTRAPLPKFVIHRGSS